MTVENSKIHDNRVPQDSKGGGIYNNGQAWVQWGSEVNNNRAGRGAGIANVGTLTITDSSFKDNIAQFAGGGLFNEDGSLQMQGGWVRDNTTALGNGGGIYNDDATATFNNVDIRANGAMKGGGFYQRAGTMYFNDVTLKDNTADVGPGGSYRDTFGTYTVSGDPLDDFVFPDPNP